MEDSEVIDAFVEGAVSAFGPSLNIERSTLKLDGWWSVAYRVSNRTFILRDEQAPTDSTVVGDVCAALTARGMTAVGADLPAIGVLTYTNLDLGYAPWVLWAPDLATGEADLNARTTEESFFESGPTTGYSTAMDDPSANARGARRLAGDPTRVVITVGVSDRAEALLRDGLGDCRLESRALGEIVPDDCGALLPTLVLVDATSPAGSTFVSDLQEGDAVTAPVVAITPSGDMHAGADATVAAADPPDVWLVLLRELLR